MKEFLQKLMRGETFSREESAHIFLRLTSPEVSDLQKSAFLAALTMRGETVDEMAGFALAMRQAAIHFPGPLHSDSESIVDTCGTGGDGSGSFNISTATALLCAAAGIRVAKHGNRSVSSKSGSADVLEALKVRIDRTPEDSCRELEESGFTFLFAQKYHQAMKVIAPVRGSLGVKTIFNLLGPLTNPARPDKQLIGTFSVDAAEKIAHVCRFIGLRHAFIVHSVSGWDEATPADDFYIFEVRENSVRRLKKSGVDFGIRKCAAEELKGGDAVRNAAIIEEIFNGKRSPQRDSVILNSALVFLLAGKKSDPKSAASAAAQIIDSGKARDLLELLRKNSLSDAGASGSKNDQRTDKS
ncbi:MAG: anthranilate phosphoribosyltransferase [Acidobacteriota bacterium]